MLILHNDCLYFPSFIFRPLPPFSINSQMFISYHYKSFICLFPVTLPIFSSLFTHYLFFHLLLCSLPSVSFSPFISISCILFIVGLFHDCLSWFFFLFFPGSPHNSPNSPMTLSLYHLSFHSLLHQTLYPLLGNLLTFHFFPCFLSSLPLPD